MNANANDSLIAAIGVGAMLALGSPPARGAIVALAAAAKFGPAALAPLFATGNGERRWRAAIVFGVAFARGQRAVDRCPSSPTAACESSTTARSATRPRAARRSASGAWRRRSTSCGRSTRARAVALALAVALCPRFKTPLQIAALAAAVLIAVQLTATHWFYFYVVWFLPLVLVARFALAGADQRDPRPKPPQLRRADHDLVAGLQPDAGLAGAADPAGRSGGDDVAGLERHQPGQVGDERRHGEDQVVGGRLLHPLAVQVSENAIPSSGPASSGVTSAGPQGAEPSNTLPGIHCGVANWRSRAERSLKSM